jgi:hypothetical protein
MTETGYNRPPLLPWNASMPALIPELIAMASDPTVKTPDLLRKAMVAARQLKSASGLPGSGMSCRAIPMI